jgi:hypothetical protein
MQYFSSMYAHLISWFILIVIATSINGCNQGFRNSNKTRGVEVEEPIYDVRALRMSDGTIRLTFVGTPRLRTADPVVRTVYAFVGPTEDAMTDSVEFKLIHTGAPGEERTVYLAGDAAWTTPTSKTATEVWIEMYVLTGREQLRFRVAKPLEAAAPLELTPFTLRTSPTTIEIGAIARRAFTMKDEYLPTSESIRLIINNAQGEAVWRSDVGQAYTQRVGRVEPERVNELHRYALEWNGKDMQGVYAPTGTYTAEIIIPAKPQAYRTQTTFLWTAP